MSKIIYSERGIDVCKNGSILLIVCPKCGRENYALNVTSGVCTWCGYNAHKDMGLKERVNNQTNNNDQ